MIERSEPRILFIDIEASDLKADIGHLISIGYKWADEKKAHVISLLDYPGKAANDDSRLLKAFEPIYNQADIVVHHFGTYYDVPFLQTRRLVHGLKPLKNTTSVDTWRICRNYLKFGSNRLERVLEVLGCPYKKTPLKLSIWSDARVGNKAAIRYVINHNYFDVLVLEWVYNRIKAVYSPHPAIKTGDRCRICGGEGQSRGIHATTAGHYRRRTCKKCGFTYKAERV